MGVQPLLYSYKVDRQVCYLSPFSPSNCTKGTVRTLMVVTYRCVSTEAGVSLFTVYGRLSLPLYQSPNRA